MIQSCQVARHTSFSSRFPATWTPRRTDVIEIAGDPELSANVDRQASATSCVSFLGLFPPKARKTVSFFVSFH
jgi:hypothetical protein